MFAEELRAAHLMRCPRGLDKRARDLLALDAVVRDACAGGLAARQVAASHLQISQLSFERSCELWVEVSEGPRRE